MRSSCQVLIFINLKKALEGNSYIENRCVTVMSLFLSMFWKCVKVPGVFCPMIPPFIYSSIDGIQFFRSANDVILSPGNENGIILPQYFQKITESK